MLVVILPQSCSFSRLIINSRIYLPHLLFRCKCVMFESDHVVFNGGSDAIRFFFFLSSLRFPFCHIYYHYFSILLFFLLIRFDSWLFFLEIHFFVSAFIYHLSISKKQLHGDDRPPCIISIRQQYSSKSSSSCCFFFLTTHLLFLSIPSDLLNDPQNCAFNVEVDI